MKKYGFGVDIGGTTCKIGLFETTGQIIDKWEIPTDKAEEGKNILPNIAASLKNKMAEEGITKDDVEGIGVGIPGPVRCDGSVSVCVNLGWKNVHVPKELEDMMEGIKVMAGNDANVAALGEMWAGGGKGSKNLVMVTLGTGVGGGIIINGSIVGGVHGAGGEIGHMKVSETETETGDYNYYYSRFTSPDSKDINDTGNSGTSGMSDTAREFWDRVAG